jgi:hypothetical protein
MRFKTLAQLGIASVCLAAVSIGIGYGTAHAQSYMGPRTNGGVAAPPMAMTPMGSAALVQDDNFLYIVRGSEVYKLNKGNLAMVNSAMLPTPNFRQNGGMRPEVVPPGGSINNGGSGL